MAIVLEHPDTFLHKIRLILWDQLLVPLSRCHIYTEEHSFYIFKTCAVLASLFYHKDVNWGWNKIRHVGLGDNSGARTLARWQAGADGGQAGAGGGRQGAGGAGEGQTGAGRGRRGQVGTRKLSGLLDWSLWQSFRAMREPSQDRKVDRAWGLLP